MSASIATSMPAAAPDRSGPSGTCDAAPVDEQTGRFGEEHVEFDGAVGVRVEIPSADPLNYHAVVSAPATMAPMTIDGQLFARHGGDPGPLVIVVPGSLGVGPNHRSHAETLFRAGYSVFLLDPFGARSVTSTVADQVQYSFAASAYDVLAAVRTLREHPAVDPSRIAAQGHSRGGSAVTTAAMRRFADAVLGPGEGLAGVYAVYPWCGHQFRTPDIGHTVLRAIIGDRDEWCSVQQVQAQVAAIAACGGRATVRIVGGAHHSFDRHEEVHELPEAIVTPAAPTVSVGDDGSLIDPWTGESSPELIDRDLMVAALKAGFVRNGASIGGIGDQPDVFEADMLGFHASVLGV
jgi:dienelactone hydrolase